MEGPWVPPQEFFVFSMFIFKGALEVFSLQEAAASSYSATPDMFALSPPPPLLLNKPRSWINSDCSRLQSSSAFQQDAGTERCFLSCPSWADGHAAAHTPAPALLWSWQGHIQNTEDLEVLITNMGTLF